MTKPGTKIHNSCQRMRANTTGTPLGKVIRHFTRYSPPVKVTVEDLLGHFINNFI